MSELARKLSPLEQAQQMAEWFPDYLYGVEAEIGRLPDVLYARMEQLFGEDVVVEDGLAKLRDTVLDFADNLDDQHNAVLYVCGYSDQDIELLGLGDTSVTINRLEGRFAPAILANDTIEEKLPEEQSAQTLPASEVNRKTPVTRLVKSISLPALHSTVRPPVNLGVGDLKSIEELALEPEKWEDKALCSQTDPEAFFPEKGGSTREAKRICLGCEVVNQCLNYALDHDERFGIWGGKSERERRQMKRGIL